MLLPEIPRQVLKDGVHFAGLIYIVPELNGLVGETVGIRAMPHDRRSIEIYHDGRWLGTAKPQGALSAEERERVLERRRQDARAMTREASKARRGARTRLAPITAPGDIEETTVVTRGGPDAAIRPSERAQRRVHLRLLGIDGIDEPQERRGA
jgi:putative transposase